MRDPRLATLTPAQIVAIEAIISGAALTDAASKAGVHRVTLYRWLRHDPAFIAAVGSWRNEAHASARNRMVALTDSAVNAVAVALRKGDIRAALVVLRSLDILSPLRPAEEDENVIERRQVVAEARKNLALDQEHDRLINDIDARRKKTGS